MTNVIVFLAPGFEEIEPSTIIDVLRRSHIKVTIIGLTSKEVKGAHAIKIVPDQNINQVILEKYDAVILPGGSPGYKNLKNNKKVMEIIKKAFIKNKLIAAICAAPAVLSEAGILKGKKCTIYPGMESELKKGGGIHQEKWIVEDGNIITSQGPATALPFAIKIVEKLTNKEKAEILKEKTLANLVLKKKYLK